MNGSPTFLFNRRTILRVLVVIGIGFALTAAALRSFAQSVQPGVVPDETSVETYAANFPRISNIARLPVAKIERRTGLMMKRLAPDVTGLPAGDSVGVASSQLGFYQNP